MSRRTSQPCKTTRSPRRPGQSARPRADEAPIPYTVLEAARLAGVEPAEVRSFLRKGLLSEERLGFAEVSLLRTARTLLEDLPRVRVERALHLLSKRFPERALSSLRLGAFGRRVVVRDGAATWDVETGQALFPFEPAGTPAPSAPLAFAPAHPVDDDDRDSALPLGAGTLLARGAALEAEGRNREALDAYEAAAVSHPDWSDPHIAAARLAETLGDKATAIRHLKEVRRLR